MMNFAALVVIASSALGQVDATEVAEESKESELHSSLELLAPYLGTWKREKTTGTGEIRSTREDKYTVLHNGRAVRLHWTETRPGGEVVVSASYIFYFDGAERKVKFIGTGSYGIVEGGTLQKVEDGVAHWDVFFTWANGNQGRYNFTTSVDDDGNGLKLGWSKYSGTGPQDMGPFEYERVEK